MLLSTRQYVILKIFIYENVEINTKINVIRKRKSNTQTMTRNVRGAVYKCLNIK